MAGKTPGYMLEGNSTQDPFVFSESDCFSEVNSKFVEFLVECLLEILAALTEISTLGLAGLPVWFFEWDLEEETVEVFFGGHLGPAGGGGGGVSAVVELYP